MSCIDAIKDTFTIASAKAVYQQSCDKVKALSVQSAKDAICKTDLKSAAQKIDADCSGEVTTADVVAKISGCEDVCGDATDAPSCIDSIKDFLSTPAIKDNLVQGCEEAKNAGQQMSADQVCNTSATAVVQNAVGNCTGEVTMAEVFSEIEACKDICISAASSDDSSSTGSSESSCPYDEEFCGELKSFFGTVADCDGKVDLPDCKKAVMKTGAPEDDAAETCSGLLNAVGGADKIIEYEEMMNFLKQTNKPKADMKEVVDMVKQGFGGSWKDCASSSSTPSILLAGLTAALIFLF